MTTSYSTDFIKKKVKSLFQNAFNSELYEEVCVRNINSLERTSYVGLVDMGLQFMDMERMKEVDIGVEIKISKGDLYAKTGHNHGLDVNYLAVPVPLYYYAEKYLKDKKMDYVGIIVVDHKAHIAKWPHLLEEPKIYLDFDTKFIGEEDGNI